jgi:iron complex outermembrane receptor protein
MTKLKYIRVLTMGAALVCGVNSTIAANFNVPSGDLDSALDAYSAQSGVRLLVSNVAVRDVHTAGVRGNLSDAEALSRILKGTGFVARPDNSGVIGIVREAHSEVERSQLQIAAASLSSAASGGALETVTVTSSKIGGDVQNIPISITALSQEQLTQTQTAAGPDLVKQVPNMSFTKTNFSGYSIQLRGIGTQAISVTTDPAVAVAFNDIPFIRNHFFEQEFYDVSQVEVLRGPQGTLYGRNATAGVVNLVSAKPTDQFEAMASIDVGNYGERRPEGMINIPVIDDRFDVRIAGEWTKRQGYSFNTDTGDRIDGRDLWSSRVSIGWKPLPELQTNLVWEHFSENDDRLRSSKQLCKTDVVLAAIDGVPVPPIGSSKEVGGAFDPASYLSQGCKLTSLYSNDAFEVPDGFSLPYVKAAKLYNEIVPTVDPYAGTTQSTNLRVIETTQDPHYKAKNDVVEFNADYAVTPSLTLTSQTGFNHDFLWSTEDYNRFNSSPGLFIPSSVNGFSNRRNEVDDNGVFCDPQVGCANKLVATDLSDEHAWQLSQEFRITSNFTGPFNFSFGGNYLHYETEENYYVFINTLTMYAIHSSDEEQYPWVSGVSDNHECLLNPNASLGGLGFLPLDPRNGRSQPSLNQCNYIDPNPISAVNNEGHNYFLSQNPYALNSYASFGEAYYNLLPDLKLTTGLRWTEDQKHFTDIPSEVITDGWGYFVTGVVNQQWDQFTGRTAVNWTPKLDFTDQTLIYGSYSHGYKAGGANPPGAALLGTGGATGTIPFPIHPLTFKPEFIDAFELGSKNTLLDGALTLNGDVFYYNYENYQISEIVDRTAINLNFDAHVKGAELEGTYEPLPGLRFNFAGGWEDTALAKGSKAVDLMDRTDQAQHPGWMVVRPYPTQASNCMFPAYVVAAMLEEPPESGFLGNPLAYSCGYAYVEHDDPVTGLPYVANPTVIITSLPSCGSCFPGSAIPAGYIGFDPTQPGINNGEGFDKNISGNKLPNAPPFTVSFGTQYTLPITQNWAGALRGDYYWQDYSWARVFNDNPYDRLRGYTNVNLTLIFTNQNGWQVMFYDKNVFNTTAITGDFLNSDDSNLTTNVFLTDPKLIGIRVTKNW